jgi:hypothetical protein
MVLNGYQYSCYNLSQYASQTPRSKIKSSPRQPPPTSGEAVDLSTVEAPPVTRCWQIGRSSMGNEMKWDQKREHLQNNEEEIIFPKSGKRTSAIQRGTWDDPLQGCAANSQSTPKHFEVLPLHTQPGDCKNHHTFRRGSQKRTYGGFLKWGYL